MISLKGMLNEAKISIPNSMIDDIKKSIKLGYTIVQVGMISPKRKGVMLMNKDYQVRGTYDLVMKAAIEDLVKKLG